MNVISKIKDIMTSDLVTVTKHEKVQRIEELFNTHNIHHIPVVEHKKLVGIVSKSDYLFFKRGFHDYDTDKRMDLFRLKKWTVEDIMTTGIATLEANDKILAALKVFEENILHAIPITEKGNLVGILTTHDIVTNLIKSKINKAA